MITVWISCNQEVLPMAQKMTIAIFCSYTQLPGLLCFFVHISAQCIDVTEPLSDRMKGARRKDTHIDTPLQQDSICQKLGKKFKLWYLAYITQCSALEVPTQAILM